MPIENQNRTNFFDENFKIAGDPLCRQRLIPLWTFELRGVGRKRRVKREKSMLTASSDFLAHQQALQQEYRCDYVVVVYEKVVAEASGKPGGPPSYRISRTIPVKLSHSVFMQMSIGILKDRLLAHRQRSSSANSNGDMRPKGDNGQWTPFALDVVGLYTFLSNYVRHFEACRLEVEQGEPTAQKKKKAALEAPSSSSAIDTKREKQCRQEDSVKPVPSGALRFQLLVEYGVDVLQVQKDVDLPTLKKYWNEQVSQEEFYTQLGKPSGMAQECSIM